MERRAFLYGLTLGPLVAPLAAEAPPRGKDCPVGVVLLTEDASGSYVE